MDVGVVSRARMNKKTFSEEYIGWVPCLSGDMFFRYTEPGLADFDVVAINYHARDMCSGEGGSRYIIATSVYDWKDSGDPGQHGWFRVVVTGKRSYRENLKGRVYFISDIRKRGGSSKDFPEKERDLMCGIYNLKRSVDVALPVIERGSYSEEKKLSELLDNAVSIGPNGIMDDVGFNIDYAVNLIDEKFLYAVDFEIDRNGITNLKYDPSYADGVELKGDKDKLAKLHYHCYSLTRQAFYYLKYLLHKHTHHDHSNDSLTTIHLKNDDPHCDASVD